MKKRCVQCAREFKLNAHNQKYCSAGCHEKWLKENPQAHRAACRKHYWANIEESRRRTREESRKRYWHNPERARELGRKRRADNLDLARALGRERYWKNPEKRREQARKRRIKNPKKYREKDRARYWSDPQKRRDQSLAWARGHRDIINERLRRKRKEIRILLASDKMNPCINLEDLL